LNQRSRILISLVFFALIAVAGCKKKAPPPPPATAPPAAVPAPTANITATPTDVTAGESVVLTWSTTGADTASISGVGDVPTSGTKTVVPTDTTDYNLVARGAGGTANATAHVTVNAPPPVAPAPPSTMSEEEMFKRDVQDIFFDYDKYDIRTDANPTLTNDATFLKAHPNIKVVIGGYCDERGSDEYNLALGQKRADAAKKVLVDDGVDASRLRTISYGKEKPFCTEHTESCWQLNRRAGFAIDNQ
jgi:peptidoglycan-associated lipoprotein